MKKAALIVTSITHHATAQETLRVQDTVSALRRNGWSVDVLTPSSTPLLSATLGAEVRVFTVPRIPFLRHALLFLRGVALASRRDYQVLHGVDEGVGIVRLIDRMMMKRFAYIAEIHHPGAVGQSTIAHASAVIVPSEDALAGFAEPPPMARLSVLPDPHAELVDNALTAAEFADALDGIYTYVLRARPEVKR